MIGTDDELALLASVLARLEDDAPRLVYADYLDEHGDEARAEFVRVQVELARLGPCPVTVYHPVADASHGHPWLRGGPPIAEAKEPCGWCPVCELRRREAALWGYLLERNGVRRHFSDALLGFAVLLGSDGGNGLTHDYPWAIVRRGFVAEVRCTLDVFMGGPCETCNGYGRMTDPVHDASYSCPTCDGTRTRPGAAELVGRQPVTRVVLTCREPIRYAYGPGTDEVDWTWRRGQPGEYSGNVPDALFGLMCVGQGDSRGLRMLSYPTRDAALAALSAACVTFGRAAAGSTNKEMI